MKIKERHNVDIQKLCLLRKTRLQYFDMKHSIVTLLKEILDSVVTIILSCYLLRGVCFKNQLRILQKKLNGKLFLKVRSVNIRKQSWIIKKQKMLLKH